MSDPIAGALARHRLWALLSALLRDGGTDELANLVRAVPALAPHWRESSRERAVALQHALGFQVAPWASAFLSADGTRGGDVAFAIAEEMGAGGFRAVGAEPDHVASSASYLAHLALAEFHARQDEAGRALARVLELRRAFHVRYLLRWTPQLAAAVRSVDEGLVAEAVDCVVELAVAEAGDDDEPGGSAPEDAIEGVRDLARRLLVPASSGAWLGHRAIADAARAGGLAVGMGARTDRLADLLRLAAASGVRRAVAGALDVELAAQDRRLAAFGGLGAGVAAPRRLLAASRAWLERYMCAADQEVPA